MDNRKLSALFNKFVGQALKNPRRLTCDVDDVLAEMDTVARANGVQLRVIWQGAGYDESLRDDRVTAYTEKNANGTFRVSEIRMG